MYSLFEFVIDDDFITPHPLYLDQYAFLLHSKFPITFEGALYLTKLEFFMLYLCKVHEFPIKLF